MEEKGVKTLAGALTALIPLPGLRRRLRRRLVRWLFTVGPRRRAKSFGPHSFATGRCVLTRSTSVGDWTGLGGVSVFGGGEVTIGDHVSTGPGLVIQTQNHDYEGEALPYGKGFVCKPVTIGDCAWIGMNVMLLPGTKIGEGAIVQMGSVVHGEIPPCAIAGGNPAKVFAWRDRAHYDELKSKGAFLKGGSMRK